MSEAYWVGSSSTGLDDLFSSAGARREWIDEAHWLGASPDSQNELLPVLFCWPAGQDHALLHLLGQSLVSGERNLVLVGQGESDSALLAGPKAVGRHNLSPRARLAARYTHPGADLIGWLEAIAADLERKHRGPAEVAWLSIDFAPEQPTAFLNAHWLESQQPLLARMDALIRRLEETQAPSGLLFSLPPTGPWLATFVELL